MLAYSEWPAAQAAGIAMGMIGGAYAVMGFLRDREMHVLRTDNQFLTKDRERLMSRVATLEDEAEKRIRQHQEQMEELAKEAARYRVKAFEKEEQRRAGDILGAADMIDRFREKRKDEGEEG